MTWRLGRRRFFSLGFALLAVALAGRARATDADEIVVVDGWVLRRSDLRDPSAVRRAVPLRTLY